MIYFIIFAILLIWVIINFINKRYSISLFDNGNVIVTGMKGYGKDAFFCVVVNARKKNYISNVNYSDPKKDYKCFSVDYDVWKMAGNRYKDFINGKIKKYVYPYPDGLDFYISDVSTYFPSSYANELARQYDSEVMFQSLSRQLGDCAVHCNSQVLENIWDKLRRQSEIYIHLDRLKWFLGKNIGKKLHVAKFTMYQYERRESFEARIRPPRFGIGKIAKDNKYKFEIAHGKIKKISFYSKIPYEYDSRVFKTMMEHGSEVTNDR